MKLKTRQNDSRQVIVLVFCFRLKRGLGGNVRKTRQQLKLGIPFLLFCEQSTLSVDWKCSLNAPAFEQIIGHILVASGLINTLCSLQR